MQSTENRSGDKEALGPHYPPVRFAEAADLPMGRLSFTAQPGELIGYTNQDLDECLAVTGPFSELRDGMTPEQRVDAKVQAHSP
jgi:hypothetical protein